MAPSALVAALAWSLVGPLARRFAPGADPTAGLSLAALALLGWVALAGLPRPGRVDRPGSVDRGAGPDTETGAGAWAVLGLALPALALGAALDVGSGLAAVEVARTVGWGLALVALLALGADRAARARAGRQRLHGALWLALVPGLAVLPAVALWGTSSASAGASWVALSPLGWTARRALEASAERGTLPAAPVAALALAAALAALAGRPGHPGHPGQTGRTGGPR
jgi:hypothetical protein